AGRVAEPRGSAAYVFAQFGMVYLRRNRARFAGARQICRSRRAVGRLSDGAGREGRRITFVVDDRWRQGGLRRGAICGVGGAGGTVGAGLAEGVTPSSGSPYACPSGIRMR